MNFPQDHESAKFTLLGDTQYIVWSTSSDKGLLALVGGKKIKNKRPYLACIGGKNKKDALKLVFLSRK